MMRPSPGRFIAALLLATLGLPAVVAQPTPSPETQATAITPAPALTIEQVRAQIKALESDEKLGDGLKTKVLDLYRQALSRLEVAQNHGVRAAAYKQAIEWVPAEVKRIQQALDESLMQPSDTTVIQLSKDTTAEELEQRLASEQADLTALKSKLAELDDQVREQQGRPAKARKALAQAKQKLEENEADLKAAPDAKPLQAKAQRTLLEANKRARLANISMLEQELLSYDTRVEWLSAQRNLTARQVSQAEKRVEELQDRVLERRRAEAETARSKAEETQLQAIGKHPAVRELAKRNAKLSREVAKAVASTEATTHARQALEGRVRQIEEDFQSAKQKLEIAGLSEALGEILRDQRKRLPNLRRSRRDAAKRKALIVEIGLNQIKVDDQLKALDEGKQNAEQMLAERVPAAMPPEKRREIKAEIRQLLKDQQKLLDKLVRAYSGLLRELGELDFQQQQLIDKAGEYAAFLDERLLWIPSGSPVGTKTLSDWAPATAWLLDPHGWISVAQALLRAAAHAPLQAILAVAMFVGLLRVRRRMSSELEAIAKGVHKAYTDNFLLTLHALLITLLSALPWPTLMAFAAWGLLGSIEASDFAKAVGAGLRSAAVWFLVMKLLRLLTYARGVGEVHFRWRELSLRLLRRNLWWLMWVLLPVTFIISATEWQANDAIQHSLGRLAFIVGMIALAVFLKRVLRLRGGVPERFFIRNPKGWLWRFRYVWYPLVVGMPVVLATIAAMGYYYTSLQLNGRFLATLWLLVGALIAYDLVMRWLFVARRKLALAKAREKREAAQAARASKNSRETHDETVPTPVEAPEVDLVTIGDQTRQMLRMLVGFSVIVGLWLIWAGVLPALSFFDNVQLWQHVVTVEGQEQLQPITLTDLGLAIVLVVVTAAAARNLPGVLEIALLQYLALSPGGRYATTTLSRYVIVAIGVILIFSTVGIGWSQVQWLVAALGIGLGFGLQEIVANFVSGLILLFERPIRVGDTVTVGDLSGTVSRLRMRATTITDWDRKELVVPNKMFITDRLINWTLSDPITRLLIKVGIAYGSDTTRAHQVMTDVIRTNPRVLDHPEPSVFFIGFGDSALDFEIRVFVKEFADRLPGTHELHMAIERALREHGIEIPFPQRDIHLRSMDPAINLTPAQNATVSRDTR